MFHDPFLPLLSAAQEEVGRCWQQGARSVADEHSAAAVRQALGGVDIELRAEVGGVEMTIEEVLALKEGDIVRLESPSANGVLLCAGPVPVHRARPGRSGRRRAVSVVGRLEGAE